MSDNGSPRRVFLKVVFGAASAGVATAVGAPVITAFLDPGRRQIVTGGREPLDYGKVIDLPVGAPRKLDVVAEQRDAWARSDPKPIGAVWLLRHPGDHVVVFSAVCPHLGCSVGFDQTKRVFACPCHESAFALDDGARLAGPSPRGLDPLPLEIRDGRVYVTYLEFAQGFVERRRV